MSAATPAPAPRPALYDEADPFHGVPRDEAVRRFVDVMRHHPDLPTLTIVQQNWARRVHPHLTPAELDTVTTAYAEALARLNQESR